MTAARLTFGEVTTEELLVRVAEQIVLKQAAMQWVLVKGWHDQGGIEGVFGPYTEEYADWLLSDLLDCSSYNWTKAQLKTGPES